jgi:transposase
MSRSLLAPAMNNFGDGISGVVAFLKTRLTNGAIEAVNGLLQLAKRLARGFRSLRYFRIMAYLKAAGLHFDLPSLKPSPPTHSR